MGGAKSQRRRAKLALEAQYGNLHKAQFGKASRHDRLPEPPTAKQLQPLVPRKFKKMQALMELAQQGHVGAKRDSAHEDARGGNKRQKRHEAQEAERPADVPEPGGAAEDPPSHAPLPSTDNADATVDAPSDGKGSEAVVSTTHALQSTSASKTKLKRKEVLKQKKKLKKLKKQVARLGGGGGKDDEEEQDFKTDHVEFGETSAAPPKVNLKRRHWDTEQTEASHKSRNKEMMLKYLKAADQRLSKKGTASVSLHARRKAQEQEQMRHTMVEAYRDKKRQQSGEMHSAKPGNKSPAKKGGTATLQTLKSLVKSQTAV